MPGNIKMKKTIKKIIIDTNFLLIPYQFKVDIFSEIRRICDFNYEICIIDKTIDELRKIMMTPGRDKLGAVLALQLLTHHKVKKILTKKDKSVDDLIVDMAGKDILVATQDMELKKRLKKNKVRLIVMRQKKYLALS